jgi:hypothetical protein
MHTCERVYLQVVYTNLFLSLLLLSAGCLLTRMQLIYWQCIYKNVFDVAAGSQTKSSVTVILVVKLELPQSRLVCLLLIH